MSEPISYNNLRFKYSKSSLEDLKRSGLILRQGECPQISRQGMIPIAITKEEKQVAIDEIPQVHISLVDYLVAFFRIDTENNY